MNHWVEWQPLGIFLDEPGVGASRSDCLERPRNTLMFDHPTLRAITDLVPCGSGVFRCFHGGNWGWIWRPWPSRHSLRGTPWLVPTSCLVVLQMRHPCWQTLHRGWLYHDNSYAYPNYMSSLLLVRCNHCLSYPIWLQHSWFVPIVVVSDPIRLVISIDIPIFARWNLHSASDSPFWRTCWRYNTCIFRLTYHFTACNFPWYPDETNPPSIPSCRSSITMVFTLKQQPLVN